MQSVESTAVSGSGPTAPFDTVELFGLPFVDASSEVIVAEHLARWSPLGPCDRAVDQSNDDRDLLPFVVTPNVDIVVQLQNDEFDIGRSMARAAYVLPDGWPIVGVSKLMGRPLQARLAGSTVFAEWWPQVVADGRRVAALVSSESVSDGLLAEHPDAVAQVPPMIEPTPDAIGAVADDFAKLAIAAEAEFLVFAIGHPKDVLLALAVLERWPADLDVPLSLCLGASAEFYLGLRKRAPEWAQRFGLEWFVRLVQEPRRMFRRYIIRDSSFIPIAAREILRGRP